ncbi:ATP-binding protein [Frateuria aurantia]
MADLRLWPRSLLGRNLMLLLAISAFAQMSTIVVYLLMQRPRIVEVAQLVAAQINTLDAALAQVPVDRRDAYIAALERTMPLHLQRDLPAVGGEAGPDAPLIRYFINEVRRDLRPGIDIRWPRRSRMQLWVHVNISGTRYWMMLPANAMLHYRWFVSVLALSLCMAALAALGAFLIQRRIHQPLRDIAAAARAVGRRGHAERLPTYHATELAAVADQFNAMVDNLEAMEASRAVMLAGISHDIRAPLTKLRLALAMDHAGSEMPALQYIQQIDAIVSQFLDYGRTGSNEELVDGDLNTLVEQLGAVFAESGHTFLLGLEPLPRWAFRPTAMMRLLHNLMDNAVKYAGCGLEVRTRAYRDGILLSVVDSGPGIPARDIPRLLQPFARADTGRSSTSGAGLGLSIVDRLVRLHAGQIELLSRTPHGLEVRLYFPPA